MRQTSLFNLTPNKSSPTDNMPWELPNLIGHDVEVAFDSEWSSKRIWKDSFATGISVATSGKDSWYLPWGHESGFNYDKEKVLLWAKDNLAGKELILANAKGDLHVMDKEGFDLEGWGCKVRDVMHPPALLDAKRQSYKLNDLALAELGRGKVEIGNLDNFPMYKRSSESVRLYAESDATLTWDLHQVYKQKIDSKGLRKVLDLEDNLIFCVASMERKGMRVDVDKLVQWEKRIQSRYVNLLLKIYQLTGLRVEPNKAVTMMKLFHLLNIPLEYTAKGSVSFTAEILARHSDKEPVRLALQAKQLDSMRNKFITPWIKKADSNNIIRYSLNQLKASGDDDTGAVGTVTGRFSASGGKTTDIDGVNVQQVFSDEKQEKIPAISEFPVRSVVIPDEGKFFLSADAKQIEFRIFAHFCSITGISDRLVKAYEDNPLIDFHDFVGENIMFKGQEFTRQKRKLTKNLNFGKLYGLGIAKLANVYLHIPEEDARIISKNYDREFPEARALLDYAIESAKEKGFVRTLLGRRREFDDSDKKYNPSTGKTEIPWYSSLNAVIQGSAADIMKIKLLNLYETRKETNLDMRFTVHDEVDGDIPDQESAERVEEILNEPAFKNLRVPILWDVGIGNNWADLDSLDDLRKIKHETMDF
jgi:DNA polymerase-1